MLRPASGFATGPESAAISQCSLRPASKCQSSIKLLILAHRLSPRSAVQALGRPLRNPPQRETRHSGSNTPPRYKPSNPPAQPASKALEHLVFQGDNRLKAPRIALPAAP